MRCSLSAFPLLTDPYFGQKLSSLHFSPQNLVIAELSVVRTPFLSFMFILIQLLLLQDIVPTTIEREISDWRHALNHAEHIDNIQLTSTAKQNYRKSFKSDSVGSTRSSGVFEGFNDTLSENR